MATTDGSEHQPQVLSGWKAIALYLGVEKSTAQRWAKVRALPVRHLPGPNSTVVAVPSELEAWLRSGPPVASQEDERDPVEAVPEPSNVLQEVQPQASPISQNKPGVGNSLDGNTVAPHTDRRRWLRIGLVGGLGLFGVAGLSIGIVKLRPGRNRHPAGYRVQGATLIVFDADITEMWRYTFSTPMIDLDYNQNGDQSWQCLFADLDGDGQTETLFLYLPSDHSVDRRLVCFNPDGSPRWQFIPGRVVTDNLRREFPPPYWINSFEVIHSRSSAATHIVVSSNHHINYPNQVAVLASKSGSVLSEYWHRGYLLRMAVVDIDGDGEPEVLLGGVNDAPEYKQATLIIFDHRQLSGAGRNPRGGLYFQDMNPGTEKCVIFFPRSPISRDEEFNQVIDIRVSDRRVTILVAEGISKYAPYVVYEFDYQMRVVDVTLSGGFRNRYLELQGLGRMTKDSPDVLTKRLKHEVRVVQRRDQ